MQRIIFNYNLLKTYVFTLRCDFKDRIKDEELLLGINEVLIKKLPDRPGKVLIFRLRRIKKSLLSTCREMKNLWIQAMAYLKTWFLKILLLSSTTVEDTLENVS